MQDMSNAVGIVYVGPDGKPLYTFDGDGKGKPACVNEPCISHWMPFPAAQMAQPAGDFTVVTRADGILQWAFRSRPLYTYDGDVAPGDAKGDGVDGKWRVVRRMRQFMPAGVRVWHNHYDGDNLATDAGMTLYVRDRVFGSTIGHSMRDGFANEPAIGRILGTAACDAECTKTWRPLAAPADAAPSGYWDVATREDGTKQWVYRGFAVYTFTGDRKPGDMLGNDNYEIMAENDPFTAADTKVRGTGAMEWHVAIP
jgi:predicted lipoprotein with Yx(FWY)xxD motif